MYRKIIFQVLVAVFAASAFVACTPKAEEKTDKTSYFRVIRFSETPWDVIAGNHPITADEAKTLNHYKFSYNEAGKLASIEFKRDSVLLNYSATGAAQILFNYTDSTETLTYFNKDGVQTEVDGKVWTSVYALDKSGVRVGLKFFGKDGAAVENADSIHSYVWTKLADGKVKEQRYKLDGTETVLNQFCPFYELRFTYDSLNYVVAMENYQGDTLYNCTAENCGETGVSYFTFENNKEGDLLKFHVRNTSGKYSNLYWGWARFEQVVDANGYVTERAYFDQDEEYISNGKVAPIRQYVYDAFGAVVEVKNLNAKREPMELGDKKVAAVKYVYDQVGHPTDTLRFDAKGVEIAK